MTYELIFFHGGKRASPEIDDLWKYFDPLDRYQVDDRSAVYMNEETGVYFLFDFQGLEGATGIGGNGRRPLPVTFRMNFVRPHVFAREAAPEVGRFVRHFDLLVRDAQPDGMGEGPYDSTAFVRGWERGNEDAIARRIDDEGMSAFSKEVALASRAVIESVWTWNRARGALQAELGEDVFIPRIGFLRDQVEARTFAVWPDAQAIALPQTDLLLFIRQELARRKILFRRPDVAIVERSVFEAALGGAEPRDEPAPCLLLLHDKPPRPLAAAVRKLSGTRRPPMPLSFDRVLERELIPPEPAP